MNGNDFLFNWDWFRSRRTNCVFGLLNKQNNILFQLMINKIRRSIGKQWLRNGIHWQTSIIVDWTEIQMTNWSIRHTNNCVLLWRERGQFTEDDALEFNIEWLLLPLSYVMLKSRAFVLLSKFSSDIIRIDSVLCIPILDIWNLISIERLYGL